MALGLILMVALPDFPDTWTALTGEMKHVANRRLAIEAAEADINDGTMSQLRGALLAFQDPKTYMLAIGYHCIQGAAGFQNFFPTLTATLGYSHVISLLLVAPPYVFMTVYSVCHGFLSDYLGNRFWFFVYPIPISIVGFIIFITAKGFGPLYFSFFLMVFVYAQNGTTYAWISNCMPRPPAKRAAALAFINSFGNAASIWTPFTYIPSSAPHYRPALGACIGLQVVGCMSAVVLRWYLIRQNRNLDKLEMEEDAQLNERDVRKLEKTAEVEGVNIAAARKLQKGYRYMI